MALATIPNLGYNFSDFGAHSFRKAIATYASGFIGGHSVIAIFLLAGWSLGQVQGRYITYSNGGDHFCGRVAAGETFLSIQRTLPFWNGMLRLRRVLRWSSRISRTTLFVCLFFFI
jgi:hypothetical protein